MLRNIESHSAGITPISFFCFKYERKFQLDGIYPCASLILPISHFTKSSEHLVAFQLEFNNELFHSTYFYDYFLTMECAF